MVKKYNVATKSADKEVDPLLSSDKLREFIIIVKILLLSPYRLQIISVPLFSRPLRIGGGTLHLYIYFCNFVFDYGKEIIIDKTFEL